MKSRSPIKSATGSSKKSKSDATIGSQSNQSSNLRKNTQKKTSKKSAKVKGSKSSEKIISNGNNSTFTMTQKRNSKANIQQHHQSFNTKTSEYLGLAPIQSSTLKNFLSEPLFENGNQFLQIPTHILPIFDNKSLEDTFDLNQALLVENLQKNK